MREQSIQDYTVALTTLYLFVAAAYAGEPTGTAALRYAQAALGTGGAAKGQANQPVRDHDPRCHIDFEDRTLDEVFPVGAVFFTNGVTVRVHEFYGKSAVGCDDPFAGGTAKVLLAGLSCGADQELVANAVNLQFDYGGPINEFEVDYFESHTNVNLSVNGDCANVSSFTDLPPVLGGVNIFVTDFDVRGGGCGVLRLQGPINDVRIGGTPLRIDDIRKDYSPPVAEIDQPAELSCACDALVVEGTASDTNFVSYRLEYRRVSDPTWTAVTSSNIPVVDGILGTWNTSGLVQGLYPLRLTVLDECGKSSSADVFFHGSRLTPLGLGR